MKRPILLITIGFIIGILLGLYFKIGIAFIFVLLLIKKLKKIVAILLISSTIISFTYISYSETQYNTKYKDVEIIKGIATVITNMEEKQYYSTCIVRHNDTNLIIKTKNNLHYGDLIKFEGNFELPSTQRNYGGFNYREYLKTKNVYGIVTCKKTEVLAQNQLDRISMFANATQNSIIKQVNTVDNGDTGGLLIGILLGNKDSISEEIQTDFKNSGLSHLLAVSGLHVNYVILAIVFALNKIRLNKRLASTITIVIIIFFMYITNFTESVVRAGTMGIIALGAQVLYRKQDTLTSIALSLLIILVENPYKLFSIGLQLSYAGTLGIVIFYPKFKKRMKDIIAVCLSAQILIFPIILIHFNLFSTHFLLANILASPLAGIVIILGFTFVLISFISIKLSMVIYLPLKLLLKLLILINYFVSNLPFSTILLKTPYLFNVIFFYIALFLHPKKIICVVLIILLILTAFLDYPKEFTIYFVDVGQGDCTLIRTKSNKTILIDGGGSENYDIGKNILLPYLLDRRITKIDYMLISHFDSDHCLSLLEVVKKLNVRNIIISKQFEISENYKRFLQLAKNTNITYVKAGVQIKVDKDTNIRILWPVDNYITDNILNNNSVVAKVEYRDKSILFTGDIEEKAENKIVSMYKEQLKSDILKVAHHGSKSSSTEQFLQAVKPKIALIGVGEKNTFGHPNIGVIERLTNLRSKSI